MPPKIPKFNNEITNHFLKINKSNENKIKNPAFENTKMNLPQRSIYVSPSGGCKNNILYEYIKRCPNTFDEIHVCAKNSDQPFYVHLRKIIPEDLLFIYEVGEIPLVDDFEPDMNRLMIFDDYVNDKKAQQQIVDWYIRSRHKGFSCCFLTQSFYLTNKTIRLNCDYIFLIKCNSAKDLKLIVSEFPLELDYKELLALYNKYTKKKSDFLLIDLLLEQIRHNFLDVVFENSE